MAEGATARVYVAAPLCAGAERVAAREGDRTGKVRIAVVCLPAAERDGKLDLATIGANARRATQDTGSVGYIGEPTPAASRFSETILESAKVAQLPETAGEAGMRKLLAAVSEADTSGSLRESVYESLRRP